MILQAFALFTVDTERTFAHIKVFTLVTGVDILVNHEKRMKIVGLSLIKGSKERNFGIKEFFFQRKFKRVLTKL